MRFSIDVSGILSISLYGGTDTCRSLYIEALCDYYHSFHHFFNRRRREHERRKHMSQLMVANLAMRVEIEVTCCVPKQNAPHHDKTLTYGEVDVVWDVTSMCIISSDTKSNTSKIIGMRGQIFMLHAFVGTKEAVRNAAIDFRLLQEPLVVVCCFPSLLTHSTGNPASSARIPC